MLCIEVQYGIVIYSVVQYCAIQYSEVQYTVSVVQCTVLHCLVHQLSSQHPVVPPKETQLWHFTYNSLFSRRLSEIQPVQKHQFHHHSNTNSAIVKDPMN